MLSCDKEGIPLLIQSLAFVSSHFLVEVTFFNGRTRSFDAGFLCPSLGIMAHEPTRMQWLEIEYNATKLAEVCWRDWFPDRHL